MTTTDMPVTARRWWILLWSAIALFVATYLVMICTKWGQTFENTALRGADQAPLSEVSEAVASLHEITIWSLAAATLGIAVVGLVRRQWLLTFLAIGVIFFGQVVTQSLKRFILPRPELIEVVGDFTHNSFPSGHTTIAMTVMVATFLVVPYRWRGVAMLVVISWAAGIGAYTMTAKWHRLSDTIGADLVALALGAIAAIILVRAGRIRRAPATKTRGLRTSLVMFFTLSAIVSALLGVFLGVLGGGPDMHDEIVEWNIYLAATSLATAGALITALVYWATWRRLEVVPAVIAKRSELG